MERPPVPSRPLPPSDGADDQVRLVDPGADARSQVAENLQHPAYGESTPGDQEAASAGHSLSDVEWDAITQAAFSRFAETESEGSAGASDQSPVR